jgi:hypothetical protein
MINPTKDDDAHSETELLKRIFRNTEGDSDFDTASVMSHHPSREGFTASPKRGSLAAVFWMGKILTLSVGG